MLWPTQHDAALLVISAGASLILALALTLFPRLGPSGRAFSDFCARAPMLDLIVGLFTWIPWIVAPSLYGFRALLPVIAGQVIAMIAWTVIHESIYRRHLRGPRIVTFLNRIVGRFRNHLSLWLTVPALPVFLMIRFTELTFYPLFVALLGFPRYRHAEWVNVSRQKFEGLVGHDLIWCLYCDWMTGVYSLGGEMLRNVESFWCPLRFYDGKKCENCRTDFPDIDAGWAPANGTMTDLVNVMEKMHAGGNHSWFAHPTRLTINGIPPSDAP